MEIILLKFGLKVFSTLEKAFYDIGTGNVCKPQVNHKKWTVL